MIAKSAYIDELHLITIPFSEIDGELSNITIINTDSQEQLGVKHWRKNDERWRYEFYLENPIKLGNDYIVIANENHSFSVKIGQVVRTEAFDNYYYYDKDDLGVTVTEEVTLFKLWAPTAKEVHIVLINEDQEQSYVMKKLEKGLWEISISGNLDGTVYMYRLCIDRIWREAVDPYARAVTVNGEKGVVVHLPDTNPSQWEEIQRPTMGAPTDAIIYEVHVRDFSIDENSGMNNKGKYKAFTEINTKGPHNTLTGLNHLIDLGISHVQLLPIQDFGSVDETEPIETYNWGYDTIHYNAIEGSYSLHPEDAKERIRELKEVISTLHQKGIRVILDVVYNHVYIHHQSNFEKIVPGYYFRYHLDGSLSDGTGVGNDIASERLMVRKFIVDSVRYLALEFKVDGFRFDLMGILDIETMNQIRNHLTVVDPSILVIGEGWDLATPLSRDKKAIIANAQCMPGICHFNDQFRDHLKGNIFDQKLKGFCNGNRESKEFLKMLISGSLKGFYPIGGMFDEPYQSVNYVECHDNHTLWDKLEISNTTQDESTRAKMHRLATAITVLSQGIPFIHAGQEFYRTKQGVENSYCSSDEINKLDWGRKALHMDYVDYVKGMIAIRKAHEAFRLPSAEAIKKNMHILDTPSACIAYLIKNKKGMFAVIHNGAWDEKEVILPSNGYWDVHVEAERVSLNSLRHFNGAKMTVEGISTTVLFHPKHQ